jgi:hypothetical protein
VVFRKEAADTLISGVGPRGSTVLGMAAWSFPVVLIGEVLGHRVSIQAFDGCRVIQIAGVMFGNIGYAGAFRLPVSSDAIAYLRENVPAFRYSAGSLCDGFGQFTLLCCGKSYRHVSPPVPALHRSEWILSVWLFFKKGAAGALVSGPKGFLTNRFVFRF